MKKCVSTHKKINKYRFYLETFIWNIWRIEKDFKFLRKLVILFKKFFGNLNFYEKGWYFWCVSHLHEIWELVKKKKKKYFSNVYSLADFTYWRVKLLLVWIISQCVTTLRKDISWFKKLVFFKDIDDKIFRAIHAHDTRIKLYRLSPFI